MGYEYRIIAPDKAHNIYSLNGNSLHSHSCPSLTLGICSKKIREFS
jgi:formylmethanofuran dehydrogenase subunit E